MLTLQSCAPQSALSPFIRSYVQREAHLGGEEIVEPVIARLGVMLEFEFAGSYEIRNYGSNRLEDANPISIIGPQTWRRARLIIRGHVQSLVVIFQPSGFHALFGVPTAPLAETGTEAYSVLGVSISHLHQHLGNVSTFPERVLVLNKYFLCRLQNRASPDPIYSALQLLSTPGPLVKVADVARQSGVNLRYLERKSFEYAGVTPKALARISRFSRALRLRAETSLTWTQIAHAAEYHDHMHMIRDFRIFAGEAPTAAIREIAPDHLINFCADP